MWDVLKEYPAARVRLESIAVKRLEKYKKAPLEKGNWQKKFASEENHLKNIKFLTSKFQIKSYLTSFYFNSQYILNINHLFFFFFILFD